ncbi:MAG TPA: hypothetical protein VGK59_14505 [Ohtaekwangia sp.]
MIRIYLLCVSLSLVACTTKDKGTREVTLTDSAESSTSRLVPEPDIIERLRAQKATIEEYQGNHEESISFFVRLKDNEAPVAISPDEMPEMYKEMYSVLKDSTGNTLLVSQNPFSESGDWFITLTHYFDKQEKTFVTQRQTNFFNSICTEGMAYETQTDFYSGDLQIITKDYRLADSNNNELQKDSCQLAYNFAMKTFANAAEFKKVNQLP